MPCVDVKGLRESIHDILEGGGLSGKTPLYELFGEELRLTIFAAESLQDDIAV